jgi:WD40 repeat protein
MIRHSVAQRSVELVRLRALAALGKQSDIRDHLLRVWYVALSPDRRQLATASFDSRICVWDAETYQLRKVLSGHDDPVYSVVFFPDGRTLASGGHDRTVRLWDLATGLERRRLESHTGAVNAVAISPDGRWLASGGYDKAIHLWDLSRLAER